MYKCHLHIYLAGHPCRAFETIKEMPPMEHFTHIFLESSEPSKDLAAKADLIAANLSNVDIQQFLQSLLSVKKEDAQVILFADREQVQVLLEDLAWKHILDIWPNSMSEAETQFRFLRWQQDFKIRKDFWQNSQYLEATINSIPNLVWYKDKNGIHEKVNDSFCRTVNKNRKNVEGRGHAYIWDVEQDDPACIESENEVMTKKETLVREEIIKTGDGVRTLMTYKSPLYNCDGSVMGTVGVAIDVTQERSYEQEILQKNQTLETIFTTIDCGVIRHTADGSRILSINKAALNILGYESQEEMLADGFCMVAQTVVEEDQEQLKECIKTLKRPGDSVSTTYRVQHKDGEILYVMGNIKLFEENGELLYQRFLLDCTAQKLEEKKSRQRQTEMMHALSIDFNYVCFIDPETGMVIPIRSDGSEPSNIFDGKLPLKESMEKYILRYVHEDDREMMLEAVSLNVLKNKLTKKNLYYVNYRIQEGNEMIYFQLKAVGAKFGDNNLGIVLGFRSVDDEIRREMEQNNLLETALSQANKANQAKSIFLSNMSHDIRTPMNAIVGFTNLAIARIDFKEQVAEYLKKIRTSGNHLLSLINDILDMSRIESGKLHMEEAPCSLSDTLCELHNILQEEIRSKHLSFKIDISDVYDDTIYCDKLRIKQVLLNLLSNSVKYTKESGSVSIQVTEKPVAQADYARYDFHIKDNGIGMSQEFVEHIFEPFEREKNSTISGIQGTGLGMAITKNIVDMMHGSIKVQSEQNKGTDFFVSFTFRLCSELKDSKMNEFLPESDDHNTYDGGSDIEGLQTARRILLVEDVTLNQEIATAILEDAGFIVEVADNGKIAVEMVEKSVPGYYQAVLMDLQMPVMDGFEATQKIRNLKNIELASIPIIAMTANAFEEDRREALRHGMNNHIAKPIDNRTLFETLNSVL